jgi:hypothetical protein
VKSNKCARCQRNRIVCIEGDSTVVHIPRKRKQPEGGNGGDIEEEDEVVEVVPKYVKAGPSRVVRSSVRSSKLKDPMQQDPFEALGSQVRALRRSFNAQFDDLEDEIDRLRKESFM